MMDPEILGGFGGGSSSSGGGMRSSMAEAVSDLVVLDNFKK